MNKARLVSLVHRLIFAQRTVKSPSLRKEITQLQRLICKHFEHSYGSHDLCGVCGRSKTSIEAGIAIRERRKTAAQAAQTKAA